MKNIKVGGLLECSSVVMGCMRIDKMPVKEVEQLIFTAALCNVNFFDHADIYGGGLSEEVFGKALRPCARKRVRKSSFKQNAGFAAAIMTFQKSI